MGGDIKMSTIGAGARVRIRQPGPVPEWSTWDDDGQRTSTPVKKRLQQLFFRGDKRVQAEVVYIGNESVRDRLKSKGQVKVELRDPAGACIVIIADATNLIAGAA